MFSFVVIFRPFVLIIMVTLIIGVVVVVVVIVPDSMSTKLIFSSYFVSNNSLAFRQYGHPMIMMMTWI